MTTPLLVHTEAGTRSEVAIDAALASLPLSYAPGERVEGSVTIVQGSPTWPVAAARALAAGALAVVVVHPQPADVGGLAAHPGLVVLDSRWASNPVTASAATTVAGAWSSAARLQCRVSLKVGSALDTALLDQLSLIRALVGPVTGLELVTRSSHGFAAVGTVAGRLADLSAVCTDAVPESASLRVMTGDGSVDVWIPSGGTAQPAHLMVTGPRGSTLSPTLYESGHRATLRRVPALVSEHSAATDLEDFAADETTVRIAFEHANA